MSLAEPPTDEELGRLYSFESGYHESFRDDERTIALYKELAERLCAYVETQTDGRRVLDVGTSAGIFLEVAGRRGWDAVGLELSMDTSELARSRGLQVVTGTLDDDPFPAESFDAVTLWDVIEHVRDPVATLRQVRRLLRPSGVVCLRTPNIEGLYPRLTRRVAGRIGYWEHPGPPLHLFEFSLDTLRRACEAAGLHVVDARTEILRKRLVGGSWKRMAYDAAVAPIAYAGALAGQGDATLMSARR